MTQVLKIAIFGLNTGDLNQLKTQVFLCLPANTNFKWVNIAEEQIDLLLVSDIFFYSTGIQSAIKERTKKYLRLRKTTHDFGKIMDDQLFYPCSYLENLQQWISQEILQDQKSIESQTIQKQSILSEPTSVPVSLNVDASLEDVFSEIFTPRNGHIQLFDATGFIAIVDTRTERVWIDEQTTKRQFSSSLNQTYATNKVVQEQIEGKVTYDLRTWLWLILNHSTLLSLPKIELNQNFKLDIWPQFEKDIHRKDNLKIAACFSEGAKIEAVRQHLNLTNDKIINFVQYANLLQLGRFIEASEAKFSLDINQIETTQTNKLKSFFGKLRKKFGL